MNASSAFPPRRPRIGVTPEGLTSEGDLLLPLAYLRAVQRAGGAPIVLPPWEADAEALLDAVDALLLAGGGDMAPHRYQSAGHPEIYGIDEARDAGELALFHGARQRGLPILGICRGAQLINVALGGTLIEHLPDRTAQAHRAEPTGGLRHTVTVPAGSRLYAVLAESCAEDATPLLIETISWHHQAIDRVAPNLRVTASAADGTVEAIEAVATTDEAGTDRARRDEAAAASWLVAVQWHPELSADHDPQQQRLFNALVHAARTHG